MGRRLTCVNLLTRLDCSRTCICSNYGRVLYEYSIYGQCSVVNNNNYIRETSVYNNVMIWILMKIHII